MDENKVINELYCFTVEPRAYTVDELLCLVDININSEALRKALLKNSRFICFRAKLPEEDQYILDSILFHWFVRLNFKLSQIKKYRLTEHQFTSVISNVRKDGRWDSVPIEAVRWGQSLGLICKAYTKNQFVFPLARILSFMKPRNLDILKRLLSDLCENRIWEHSLRSYIEEFLRKGFSKFRDDISYIVRNREGLQTQKKVTLQKLGNYFKKTRERIRQLEDKFWYLYYLRISYREPFLSAFLCDFMDNSGSLIIDNNSRKANLRRFLTKCAGVPLLELANIGLVLLAAKSKDFNSLRPSGVLDDDISPKSISNVLESKRNFNFSGNDIQKIGKKISLYRKSKLNKSQKVYLTLCCISKPAHYSKITEVYNFLWPDDVINEHNIHSILNRQRYGICWIGIKGTYALKKWGYERPSKTLFETVADIVRGKYEETGIPVQKDLIVSEIGRYRKIVHPSSIAIAIHFNPKLRQVYKDTFIPKKPDEQADDDFCLDELDKILNEFEKEF